VIDPAECTALLKQVRETFELELAELNRRDAEGENVDGDDDADSDISDMQDMMDTLAPLDAEALLAVTLGDDGNYDGVDEEKERDPRQARLGSWGGRYLVGDLYAQATWLRDHAARPDNLHDERIEITFTMYLLWFFGGLVTGAHWLYLARSGSKRWKVWHAQRGTIPTVSGPPPPPEVICGITGKVMQDPYTLRTAAVQGIAASTTSQKLFGCNHTFDGEALFQALSVERKCPRCGMRPYTISHRQSGIKALMIQNLSVGKIVDRWYTIQNLIPPSAPAPPSNVWPCIRRAMCCWGVWMGSVGARLAAFALSTGCDDSQVPEQYDAGTGSAALEFDDVTICAWDHQSTGVAVLYLGHVFFTLVAILLWVSDGVSGYHTAYQVTELQHLTVLCSSTCSAAWNYLIVIGFAFLAFAVWHSALSTEIM
jgi:hypothetical protein